MNINVIPNGFVMNKQLGITKDLLKQNLKFKGNKLFRTRKGVSFSKRVIKNNPNAQYYTYTTLKVGDYKSRNCKLVIRLIDDIIVETIIQNPLNGCLSDVINNYSCIDQNECTCLFCKSTFPTFTINQPRTTQITMSDHYKPFSIVGVRPNKGLTKGLEYVEIYISLGGIYDQFSVLTFETPLKNRMNVQIAGLNCDIIEVDAKYKYKTNFTGDFDYCIIVRTPKRVQVEEGIVDVTVSILKLDNNSAISDTLIGGYEYVLNENTPEKKRKVIDDGVGGGFDNDDNFWHDNNQFGEGGDGGVGGDEIVTNNIQFDF